MKKVLEAELLSIAHRILQMKNKDDVQNLYHEAKELYEKLLILKFHQDNFNLIQPNIQTEELESKLENAYEKVVEERSQMPLDLMEEEYPLVVEAEPGSLKKQQVESVIHQQATKVESVVNEEVEEQYSVQYPVVEPVKPFVEEEDKSAVIHYLESEDWTEEDLEEDQDIDETSVDQTIENEETTVLEEVLNQHLINNQGLVEGETPDTEVAKTLEDSFFGIEYQDVDFIRIEEIDKEHELKNHLVFEPVSSRPELEGEIPVSEGYNAPEENIRKTDKPRSLNDAFSQNIAVSLNDRIAFEKYLFNGSTEDFNRVLSQLSTFNTIDQAVAFIEDLVKPDYNYWTGKEEYVGRLMDLIEKRFA